MDLTPGQVVIDRRSNRVVQVLQLLALEEIQLRNFCLTRWHVATRDLLEGTVRVDVFSGRSDPMNPKRGQYEELRSTT